MRFQDGFIFSKQGFNRYYTLEFGVGKADGGEWRNIECSKFWNHFCTLYTTLLILPVLYEPILDYRIRLFY